MANHQQLEDRFESLHKQEISLRAQILELQHQLADVLALRNSLLPIARLPDDILLPIFSSFVPTFKFDTNNAQTRTISQVSRQWRTMALSFPSLWTDVFLWKNWGYIQQTLERSRDMPLRLSIRQRSLSDNVRTLIASEAHRIRAFAFSSVYSRQSALSLAETMRVLKILFSSPAFKDLQMSAANVEHGTWGKGGPTGAAAIESLTLYGTSASPRVLGPFVHSVTRFTFTHIMWLPTSDLDNNLIELLRHMPLLERLTMSIDSPSPNGVGAGETRAALPRLSFLQLSLNTPLRIVSRLEYPRTVRYRIMCGRKDDLYDVSHFFEPYRSLALEWTPADGERLASIALRTFSAEAPSSAELALTEVVVENVTTQLRHVHELALMVTYGRHRDEGAEIGTLTFVGFDDLPGDAMVGAALPPCRTLRVVRGAPGAMPLVLHTLLASEARGVDIDPPFLRSLRALEVCGMRLGGAEEAAAWRAKLLDLGERRREMGLPLDRISFSDGWEASPADVIYSGGTSTQGALAVAVGDAAGVS